MKHNALFYRSVSGKKVSCDLCPHKCVISHNEFGYCGVRQNIDGKLYSLIYGEISSAGADPIEKKPLYHFYPGSSTFSVGSLGCNMRCRHCQNWQIAHSTAKNSTRSTTYISPERLIELTLENRCQGISWTYNEPTIWIEYAIDSAKLAKSKDLYTVFVTNGYIELDALDAIGPFLDAYRVDIKGFDGCKAHHVSETEMQTSPRLQDARYCFYKDVANVKSVKPILDATIRAKTKWNMHVEIITNIVPGYNDDAEELHEIARWIVRHLGDETPWHLSKFYPYLGLSQVAQTPISTLELARKIGVEEGLKYVYTGNVPGHKWENTYCHECGKMLIERAGFSVITSFLENLMCPQCGFRIPIIGNLN
ncbi:MAG: AmmeMemoRadiSam system radical SAM enzyme [Candidatus Scalindua sp.]|nr:AmmeMemoRadiSam system radical SAM enzyme [Candidatus Scalindua sp.]